MPKYFTYKTNPVGFFDEPPEGLDFTRISDEKWDELLSGQSQGKIISTDDEGRPTLQSIIAHDQ